MLPTMAIVTLITDYGTRDYYVGALKGVILGIAPEVRVVDITHDVEPHNIAHAAFVLWQVWSWYPEATVHLAIVDPGVGSSRRIILGQYAGRYVIAPDNGLVTLVHQDFTAEAVYVVEDRRYFLPELSTTFHGRDVMAPVAAHLAAGVKPRRFGPAADRLELLPVAHHAVLTGNCVRGSVLYVDRFGTMVTNIRSEQLASPHGQDHPREVLVNGRSIGPVCSSFSDVPSGEPVAFVGSCGLLEIAVNRGNAVNRFGPAESARIEVR
jgi:hypothetical protein